MKYLILIISIILYSLNFQSQTGKIKTDSNLISVNSLKNLEISGQNNINRSSVFLDNYYAYLHKLKIIDNSLNENEVLFKKINNKILFCEEKITDTKKIIIINQDSINNYEKNLSKIKKKSKKIDSLKLKNDTVKILNKIQEKKEILTSLNKSLKILNKKNDSYHLSKKSIEKKIEKLKLDSLKNLDSSFFKQYNHAKINLSNTFKDSIGGFKFNYKNQSYLGFISDLKKHKIQFHLNFGSSQKIRNIKNLLNLLDKRGDSVLMITNGGMYTPNNEAEGLLISNQKEIEPIDLDGSKQMLNFYMMPNGVFYINENKAYIEETNQFNNKYKSRKINPSQATQSGPMLVINDEHHPAFNHGSKSKKLRSGVGIMKDGRIVFIISKNSITNFHDFATIFKDIYGCENALFLDGVISKMYIKGINYEKGGNFGPIISISNKN